jgi:hypothetical protein
VAATNCSNGIQVAAQAGLSCALQDRFVRGFPFREFKFVQPLLDSLPIEVDLEANGSELPSEEFVSNN